MNDELTQKLINFDLLWSVREGNYAKAAWLLAAGANPDTTCREGHTCIFHATQLKNPMGGTSQLGVAFISLLQQYGAALEHRQPPMEET